MAEGVVDGALQPYYAVPKPFFIPGKMLAGSLDKLMKVLGIDFFGVLETSREAFPKSTTGILNALVLDFHPRSDSFLHLNDALAESSRVTRNQLIQTGFQLHHPAQESLAVNIQMLANTLPQSVSVLHDGPLSKLRTATEALPQPVPGQV